MAQRRVVTETVGGRSTVLSDGPAAGTTVGSVWIDELWINSPDRPLGWHPDTGDSALTPPPGSLQWRIFSLPPDEHLYREGTSGELRDGFDVVESDGWHRSDTIDYVVVLDGDITLELDDADVELGPGDCVVQRQTRHVWRNKGETPVRLLSVMLGIG